SAVQAGVAVAVVDLAFVRIAKDGVGFGSFLELGGRFFVAGIAVGVILHGQSAVGLLDLVVRGFPLQSQDFIVVPLFGHSLLCDEPRGAKPPSELPSRVNKARLAVSRTASRRRVTSRHRPLWSASPRRRSWRSSHT